MVVANGTSFAAAPSRPLNLINLGLRLRPECQT
jgi:hypothetical protein